MNSPASIFFKGVDTPGVGAGVADNGLSFDAARQKIVLGNDVGEAGDPAQLLSNREIRMMGFILSLINNNADPTDSFSEISNSNLVILRNDFQRGIGVTPGMLDILDAVDDQAVINLSISGGVNNQGTITNDVGILKIGHQGLSDFVQYIIASGNFRVGTGADNGSKLQVNGNVSMTHATANLDFPNTAAQTSSDLTIAFAGAALNDTVVLGVPNGSVLANSCFTAWVSAAGVITVRFNNYSAGALNPPAGDFKVSIFKTT